MSCAPVPYRPDIDGLRTIAVLSVFLHHLNAALLPGGYIGVDIFFVISGFLITGQVYREAVAGDFSLRLFYQRRINRIMPALAVVVATTVLAGAVLLSPNDLVLLTKSAASTLTGLSNVFFWLEYGNYFTSVAAEAPLLHTWSLAVEEQFYVVWPLLIVLMLKVAPGRLTGIVLTLLTLAAIVVSELGTRAAASASYYLLPTRLFELMLGGLLAILTPRCLRLPRVLATATATAGLALVVGAFLLLDKQSPFPGFNAFWPAFGTVLLILAGETGPLARLLAARPMVFTGRLSYSLYLWHWPLIAYLNHLDVYIGLVTGASVIATAFLLSWLSWRYVETPLRQSGARMAFKAVFLRRFALPLAAVLLVAGVVVRQSGFPERFDAQVATFESHMSKRPNELRAGCHAPNALYATPPKADCRLGADKPVADAILIGDSYANHFTGLIDVMARAADIAVLDYTMDGCPPILDYASGTSPLYVERCRLRNQAIYATIASGRYRQVILAGNWPEEKEAGDKLLASVAAIASSGATVTIVLANARIGRATQCPLHNLMYGSRETCSTPPQPAPAYFATLRRQHPTLRFVDPNRVICTNGRCSPVLHDVLLYRDSGHLNDIGSRTVGQALVGMGTTL